MRRTLNLAILGSVVALSLSSVLAIACGGSAITPDGGSNNSDANAPVDDSSTPVTPDSSSTNDGGSDAMGIDVNLGPSVAVKFGNCASFKACGGSPTGVFKVSDICVDTNAVLAQAKNECPTISASNWNGSGAGGLTVAGTNWASMTQTKMSVDIDVPQECKGQFSCGLLAAALKSRGFDKATCKDNAGAGCDCSVTTEFDETSNGAFTQNGSRITASNNITYDYCREGTIVTLNPQQQNGGAAPIYYTYSE